MNAPVARGPLVCKASIVSQLGPEIDATLAEHDSRPTVRDLLADETPWALRTPVDVLLVKPFVRGWLEAPVRAPASWPGRLRWVMTASTGVDCFPRWLLDAPVVTCACGVSAGPIAEYPLAAVLTHAKRIDAIRIRRLTDFRFTQLGSLEGQTLGLAGYGAIGQAIASRARLRPSHPRASANKLGVIDGRSRNRCEHGGTRGALRPSRARAARDAAYSRWGGARPRKARLAHRQCRARFAHRSERLDRGARFEPCCGGEARCHRSRAAARGTSALFASPNAPDAARFLVLVWERGAIGGQGA